MINETKVVQRPLRTSDGPRMSLTFKGELSQLFKFSYNHVSLGDFLSNPELRQKLVNMDNETDVNALAKLELATNLLEDIFSYVLPEHSEAHRIEVWKDKIDFLKCQWPCHGLPDGINKIAFEVGRRGNLIDYYFFKVNPESGENVGYELRDVDEAFISALFDDAKKFGTFNNFGRPTKYSDSQHTFTVHYYGKEESVR